MYFLAAPPPLIAIAKGKFTVNFPLGAIPIIMSAALGPAGIATISPFLALTTDITRLTIVAIPREGLPIVTSVGVELRPGAVAEFEASIEAGPPTSATQPVLEGVRLEFRGPRRNLWVRMSPVGLSSERWNLPGWFPALGKQGSPQIPQLRRVLPDTSQASTRTSV